MAVVSATFESGLGLSAYIHFSCYLDQRNVEICEVINNKFATSIAHGLGTYRWLNEDVATTPLNINQNPYSGYVEASVADANQLLQSFQINHQVVQRNFTGEEVCRYQLPVDSTGFSCLFNIHEIGQISNASQNLIQLMIYFAFDILKGTSLRILLKCMFSAFFFFFFFSLFFDTEYWKHGYG